MVAAYHLIWTVYGVWLPNDPRGSNSTEIRSSLLEHRDQAGDMIGFLQDDSWKQLIDAKTRPGDHPVWGGPGWIVYLNTIQDVERTIR